MTATAQPKLAERRPQLGGRTHRENIARFSVIVPKNLEWDKHLMPGRMTRQAGQYVCDRLRHASFRRQRGNSGNISEHQNTSGELEDRTSGP